MKKDILSFDDLKIKAEEILKKTSNDYKRAFNYYDIRPKINYNYIKFLEKINDKNIGPEITRLMYTLDLKDRLELNHLLIEYEKEFQNSSNLPNAKLIQERSTETIFKDILKLFNTNISFESFQQSLKSENFIKEYEFKCPFYEGNDEFFFYGLIMLIKLYIITSKDLYNINDINNEYKNEYGKFNFIILIGYPKKSNFKQITSLAIKISEDNADNDENSEEEINFDKYIISNITKEEIENIFKMKKGILQNFSLRYLSKEFEEKFNQIYERMNDKEKKKFKRIYPIFLIHSLVIYVGQKTFNKKILSYSFNILYEFEKDKLETLNKLLDIKQIEIYDEKQKYNYLENIQNKDYKLKINGDELTINFFDYILSNLQIVDYISLDIFIKI